MTLERFWSKVNKTDGCWEWTGARTAPGWHGVVRTAGRKVVAHRFAWELENGPVPDGLRVLHHCDNPACVRADHLWLGTQRENMIDASAKGRTGPQLRVWTHCKNGHEFTPENTHRAHGRRRCRTCHNEERRQRRALAGSGRTVADAMERAVR